MIKKNILCESLKLFLRNKVANSMLTILIILISFTMGVLLHEPYCLKEVDDYIKGNNNYQNLYSIARSTEMNNYNANTIYILDELENNQLIYRYLEKHFKSISYFPNLDPKQTANTENGEIDLYYCNQGFREIMLKENLLSGTIEVLEKKEDYIPAILGGSFQNINIGDIFNNKYIVCGILKPGAFIYDLHYNYSPISMDNMLFEYFDAESADFLNYSFAVSNTKILPNKIEELEKINLYAQSMGMDKFRFIKDADQIEMFRKEGQTLFNFELYFLLCMIFLLIILSYIYENLKFRSIKSQLVLKYMMGANKKQLFYTIFYESLIHIMLSLIFTIILNMYLKIIFSILWIPVIGLLAAYILFNYILIYSNRFE